MVALAYAVPAYSPDMDSADDAAATVPTWTVRHPTQSQRSYASRRLRIRYAMQCLSPSSQCCPVEDTDVLTYAPGSQYVTAT